MSDYDEVARLQHKQQVARNIAIALDNLVKVMPAYPAPDLVQSVRERMEGPHHLDQLVNFANAVYRASPAPTPLRRGSPDAGPDHFHRGGGDAA